jgi:imidazolonepropionase-like amidohydrolase
MQPPRHIRSGALALCALASVALGVAPAAGQAEPGLDLIPMGTTRGQVYDRLVIRDVIMISGRGTPGTGRGMPAEGPVDIVVENGRIVDIYNADPVSAARNPDARPRGDGVIEGRGMYVIPGMFDLHAHMAGVNERAGPRGTEYHSRLLLGHGVTTVLDPGTGAGLAYMVEQRRLSAANEIAAPRMFLYQRWPATTRTGTERGHTPDEARALVRRYREQGADGIKISKGPGHYPDVIAAITDEARKVGMRGVIVDLKVGEVDARIASDAGVQSIEHWYGVPDAALSGSQHFPPDYNYMDELARFRYAADLWRQADEQPDRITEVLRLMKENGTSWNVTFAVYEANRDLTRAQNLPQREAYGHPALLAYFEPDEATHASYHYDWKTSDDIRWKENYRIWMRYVRRFHEMGGNVTLGTDAGSLYGLYGTSNIRELELLQEAGIHPIDIIRIATTNSARAVGLEDQHCGIRIGCVADLAVIAGNPLDDFKVMYDGGVRWTIKEGIVFDAPALLAEVRWYVDQAKREGERKTSSRD